MTLQEVKDQVTKEYGYKDFEHFDDESTFAYNHATPEIITNIATRYATECCKATLEKASIEVKLQRDDHGHAYKVDKESITSPENIVLL